MVALFLRPDADQSDGAWLNETASATNLFNSVDEPTTPSDTDYIVSSTTDGDKVRLRLSDPSSGVAAPLIVRYRCKRTGTQAANLIGRLYQGTSPGTLITAFTQLGVSDTFTTYTYTLTSGEFASITDFTDLYVEFELSQQSSLKVDLNFAAGVYYDSGTVADATGNLSCTRASTAFAKNADGTLTSFGSNTLRIGVGTGLLIEDARTNFSLRSQEANDGSWAKNGSTITADAAAAPDGTTTMDQVVEDGTNARHGFERQYSINAGVATTVSFFAKDVDRRYVHFQQHTASADRAFVYADLQTGTITQSGVTGAGVTLNASGIEAFANSTYRVWMTVTSAGNLEFMGVYLSDRPDNTTGSFLAAAPTYTGTGKSIHVWGMSFESGAFLSSYIPAVGTAVTRAADNVTTSGSLQTVINAATGSLVAQTDNGGGTGFAANVVDSNGTNLLGFNASNNALASITATLATGNTANRTTQDKLGLAWNASGRSLVLNGGTVATDATAQTPSATQHIGSTSSANFVYAYVERITAFNTKVADATLQGFTV